MGVDVICYVYILESHIEISLNGYGTHSCVTSYKEMCEHFSKPTYNPFHFIESHLNKSQSQTKKPHRVNEPSLLVVGHNCHP